MISVKPRLKTAPTALDMHITFGFLHAMVPRDHRPARRLEREPFFVKRDPKGVCDEGVVESLCVMSETGAPQGWHRRSAGIASRYVVQHKASNRLNFAIVRTR